MNCRARGSARQPLFVYGTLRRASGHPMSRALAHNARQVGPGAIRGRMYYPGPYPAVIEDDRAGWISGEVVEVRGGAHLWVSSTFTRAATIPTRSMSAGVPPSCSARVDAVRGSARGVT